MADTPSPEAQAMGRRMRDLRKRMNWSQEDIHEKRTYISNVERGVNQLTGRLIVTYAEKVGVAVSDIEEYRDGKIGLDELLDRHRRRDAPTAQVDSATRLKEAAHYLHVLDGMPTDQAWLLVGTLDGVQDKTVGDMYLAARKRKAGIPDYVRGNSLPPAAEPAALSVQLASKRKR